MAKTGTIGSDMVETAETIIIGAGIIGVSTALQLARRARGKIIVLDKGSGPAEGSTGASSAVCRAKYSLDETVMLARDGISAYRNWADFLEISDPVARYHRHGVVWLGDGRTDWPAAEAKRLSALGLAAEALSDDVLAERYPALSPCIVRPDLNSGEAHDCRGGGMHLLECDGGYIDPVDALQDLIRAARAGGVDVRFGAQVTAIAAHGGKLRGVRVSDGAVLDCENLVNAAGPWCNTVFDMVGLANPWPLEPTRIQIVHVDRPETLTGHIPVCADPLGGIYFRTQNRGQQILVGSILEQDERETVADSDNFDQSVDDEFARSKLHALQHRLPGLNVIRGVRGYSGLYTMNQMDVHPVVGATPLHGFYVANGFSGHGLKLAPAIGSLVAQAITGISVGSDTTVDPSFLAFDRKPLAISTRSVLA